MAVPFPQYDNQGVRGGADAWDDGPAGVLLSADYFAAPSGGPTTYFVSVGGAITALSAVGKFSKQFGLLGSIAMSGALSSRIVIQRTYGSSITPSGSLRKGTRKRPAGSITAAGGLRKRTRKPLAGAITVAGSLRKRVRRALAGAVLMTSILTDRTTSRRVYGSSITPNGSLISGVVAPPEPNTSGRLMKLYKFLK